MSQSLGLDFGTTNSVVAAKQPGGQVTPAAFRMDGEAFSTIRSVLCFWNEAAQGRPVVKSEAGPWAIREFIENPEDTRFLQSLKTFAASPYFQGTTIYGKRHAFEDLLAVFFKRLRDHADGSLDALPPRLIVGRPVRYAGAKPSAQLAMTRYQDALSRFGFESIHYVYEPVAAAFFYAQRLTRDATILVADFGGGTTDFSIMRFEVGASGIQAQPLGHGGVGIAGDRFDFRIIDNVISPLLGKGTRYDSMGKQFDLPQRYFTSLGRWNQLSVMKGSDDFRELKRLVRSSTHPELLENFIDLIEQDQGYPLYKAVAETKAALSHAEEAQLTFRSADLDVDKTIRRSDFESWIAPDLARIAMGLDEALRSASLGEAEVDKVFLTGGTSFVPAVRRLFANRFGADKIETGDELLSIANGLALIGESDNIDAWTAPPDDPLDVTDEEEALSVF